MDSTWFPPAALGLTGPRATIGELPAVDPTRKVKERDVLRFGPADEPGQRRVRQLGPRYARNGPRSGV